jgi:stearoyl-CoA desaturase (delta-9 desaturase)
VLDLSIEIHAYTQKGERKQWYESHPGGKSLLDAYVGRDCTNAFDGEMYHRHSAAAGNLIH